MAKLRGFAPCAGQIQPCKGDPRCQGLLLTSPATMEGHRARLVLPQNIKLATAYIYTYIYIPNDDYSMIIPYDW